MIERGKYQSLTMVNWNGFFARTFDIDQLVTTLSGGNGAGKSTTMAAFITALIPDQSLLHFRNTTEAGSSNASRDKGLHGKLQGGVCYAALDVINSRKQRTLFVTKLQQVAGRDKKVDIKPFIIQGLPSEINPNDILIEQLDGEMARVRQLHEVKDIVAQYETAQFKAFNAIVDYHTYMFDFGVLPRKLRNSSDRSKFYKLIEASLYGGISSAITRSLRDYLLPQNGGVKKAFQDMESALRENRATLEAIKLTQRDRDLFKHLLQESTNYVAADYMRHANDRYKKIDAALVSRNEKNQGLINLAVQQKLFKESQLILDELLETENHTEQDLQAATDHYQWIQNAVKQQKKIYRYQDDLAELSERFEEQQYVVEETQEALVVAEENSQNSEEEVDSLKTQLSDFQQALDAQQTRALQYQQAMNAVAEANQLLEQPVESAEQAKALVTQKHNQQQQLTQQVLKLKHDIDLSAAQQAQFEQAFSFLNSVVDEVQKNNAHVVAVQALEKQQQIQQQQATISQLTQNLQQNQANQKQAEKTQSKVSTFHNATAVLLVNADDIEQQQEQQRAHLDEAEYTRDDLRETRTQHRHTIAQLQTETHLLRERAPAWLKANQALNTLKEQSGFTLANGQETLASMQKVMEVEQANITHKNNLATQREQIESEIEQLSHASGTSDARLKNISDAIGGVLLSEIYDDIAMEDAAYFSAMYGPARNAIVVSNFEGIKERLADFGDLPEDVYFLEGDADAFDDSNFKVEEMEGAICVQVTDRQLRLSTLPDMPLFGKAARESRLETLREQRENVLEEFAKVAFDVQKSQRLYQNFNDFVAQHIQVAFNDDPEQQLQKLEAQISQLQNQVLELNEQETQISTQLTQCNGFLQQLFELQGQLPVADVEMLMAQQEAISEKLSELESDAQWLTQHQNALNKLAPLVDALRINPKEFEQSQAKYQQLDTQLLQIKAQIYALENVVSRRTHFGYEDATSLLNQSSQLTEQLKSKLDSALAVRANSKEKLKQTQTQFSNYNQLLITLQSSLQVKQEMVNEFLFELKEMGVSTDEGSLLRAEERKNSLMQGIQTLRARKADIEKTLTATELESKALVKQIKKIAKEYQEQRQFVVVAKAGWCSVLKLAREHDVERRLHKRELAYLSENELRSMSDKSLGALRVAVAGDTDLRDALRASEDTAYPERKVLFYIAVYQFLRERIRQDIIHTDDPVVAIEEMEIELARLTEELTQRENRLAISSESVASIITKTIQREQNRIRLLNQGLSNIHFGQVKGVRLNVSIRESHQQVLQGLADAGQPHQDLFNQSNMTFSEAMAKLFQRVNPHIDTGQRSAQIFGEELLDYRNYLELSIEVNRGGDGWLQAESGALSTGEAIGTGQSILLMVVQSWEEESRRLRAKDILPCRLLFLDEAARLDTKSISTLFELCERLDMQLLIAAPENISPERGTTYKLMRKVFKDHEHVHVVGLRGFEQNSMSQVDSPQPEHSVA